MTTLVHAKSKDCLKEELDVFDVPPTQTSLEVAQFQQYAPTTTLAHGGPIDFYVPGTGRDYIDLMHTCLYLKVKIVNGDGAAIAGANDVTAPVNLLLHSLFSSVEVTLNGRVVCHMNSMYPYRAIVETLLNYSSEAENGYLQSALFYKDTAGAMDAVRPVENVDEYVNGFDYNPVAGEDGAAPAQVTNQGLYKRWLFTRGSQSIELMGPLHADLFQQEKYLINNVDLGIKLTRARDEFALMTERNNDVPRVVIEEASLFVRRVKVSDSVFLAQQSALRLANAVYPISNVVMKKFSIPQGNLSGTQDNVFLGQLPVEMVVMFVDNAAATGAYNKNPFNFQNYNISSLSVKYAGRQIPAKPLRMNFTNQPGGGNYVRAFQNLFLCTGKMFKDKSSIIKREDFPRGYSLFAFDFRADIGCRGHYNLKQMGAVQLEVSFAQPLPHTVHCIVYAEFDNYIEVTSEREIIYSG